MKNCLPQEAQPSELSLYIIRKLAYDILEEKKSAPTLGSSMMMPCGIA